MEKGENAVEGGRKERQYVSLKLLYKDRSRDLTLVLTPIQS